MRTRISDRKQLRDWVNDALTHEATDSEAEAIVCAICKMDHPLYGKDWTEFLETLPENLYDLLEEQRP